MKSAVTKNHRTSLISLTRKLRGALGAISRRYCRVNELLRQATQKVKEHWAKHGGGHDEYGLPILNAAPTKNDVMRNRELRKEVARLYSLAHRIHKLQDGLNVSHRYIHHVIFWEDAPVKSLVARAERRLVAWRQLKKDVEKGTRAD